MAEVLDERKAAILRAVVTEYVRSAQPVGSAHVAKAAGLNVSSATVRNEMAVLEQEGFLVQPHTSAGRVPTDKGYRHYVDQLMRPGAGVAGSSSGVGGALGQAQVHQVRSFFDAAHGAIESMLQNTSKLLSDLTNYAAVVVGPAADRATVKSVVLVGLSARVALVVVVLSNGAVLRHSVEFAVDTAEERIATAGAHLAAHLVGGVVGHTPVPSSGVAEIDDIVGVALAAIEPDAEPDESPVFVGGTARMAEAFDAVQTVRQVLGTLEQQYVVVGLLRDILDRGLSVAIGVEHGVEPLAACSVIVAPYAIDGEPLGAVGVLGPTRMNYPQALAAVEVVSERLGRRLSEG
jgi:heat-inducible transcriptional repressor